MKAKVYFETTIPSYLVARPSRDLLIAAHQQLTRDWWESRGPAFDLYVSEPVLEEAAAGDALHIAVATSYACEYLLTWNCRHIANAEIQRSARLVVRRQGFELPTICTPEELMGGGE